MDSSWLLAAEFKPCEKITQLKAGSIVGVGPVDGIALNAVRPFFADGAGFRVRGISGAHEFAQVGDGVFFFQRQYHNRSARHKRCERIKERPLTVDSVKALGLLFSDLEHLHADDAKAFFLHHVKNISRCAFGYGVRLDNGKSALQCLHSDLASPEIFSTMLWLRPCAPAMFPPAKPATWLRRCLRSPAL